MFEVEATNYRVLTSARCAFAPGLTIVIGPNGAGKTTLLDLPALLRHAAERGLQQALAHHGGVAAKSWLARGENVRLAVRCGRLRWELCFANEGDSLADLEERLWVDDEKEPFATQGVGDVIVRVGRDGFGLIGGGPAAWSLARTKRADLAADFGLLADARLYSDFAVYGLRTSGSKSATAGADTTLHPSGMNAFHVLRNWRDRPVTRARYDFVIASLAAAFPKFRDLAFQGDSTVVYGGFVFDRDLDREEPARTAANGLLVALLQATAVASAPANGYVGLDEPENALHPFAIRALLEAFEARAIEQGVSLALATHSPVVLDHAQSRPERVLVIQPEDPRGFVPLTEIRDRDYLNDFSLGNMYASQQFGAQKR